ncbi:hypothetical protein BGZ65_004243 [Modicella reniformis]|uniref:PXA domain-containing protein n=1 Tax=Modicella reniformis TaxID=1440133 RepID=A0A9P6MH06_9FUNG|nr:hypothetical protein BGZ65_004243 [Modicella reniformis]
MTTYQVTATTTTTTTTATCRDNNSNNNLEPLDISYNVPSKPGNPNTNTHTIMDAPMATGTTTSQASPSQPTMTSEDKTRVHVGSSNENSSAASPINSPTTVQPDLAPEPSVSSSSSSLSISSSSPPTSSSSSPPLIKDDSNGECASDTSQKSDLECLLARIMNLEEQELRVVGLLMGLVFVCYILPRIISWGTILVYALGMGIGGFVTAFYLLAVPEDMRLKRARRIANFGKHDDGVFEIIDGVPLWSSATEKQGETAKDEQLTESKNVQCHRVCISPDIDPMVEEVISFALRDFVNVPIGLLSEGQHNIPLRASLVGMAMNVAKRLNNMRLPETALLGVFGLQNSFIVHLRAYRELRASRLPIAEYVKRHANSDSVLGRCYRKEERVKQFRSIAKDICQALLMKNDQQSVALFAVMREITATHALESSLEHICDPDFVNLYIINYFSTPTEDSKVGSTGSGSGSKGSLLTLNNNPEAKIKEAPITSLADSILMNAAHLMGKGKIERQGTDMDISGASARPPTPDRSSVSSEASTAEETNITDHQTTIETSKISSSITLKQVLTNKNNYMDIFQEFMAYLQVWDAMDLVQFWLMIDVFHRQVEQGDLNSPEAVRREASSIYETYCGSDQDSNLTGIREAKGGTLLKNLKRNIQRDPANCFQESQEWASGVLEVQYWVPFNIRQQNARKAKEEEQRAGPPPSVNDICSQESIPQEPLAKVPISSARSRIQAVYLTDITNRKPKILMSNTDLAYMVEIQTEGGQGWVITRTFQQLEQLQSALINQFPAVQRPIFPRWRLQPSEKVCNGFQHFLNSMLVIPEVSDSESLVWFFSKEYDQNPDAGIPGANNSPNATSGFISAMAPLSENTAAFGAAAAQGAKSALKQASEASLSAGRFFKYLGTAVSSGGSQQNLTEDRNGRGSFESERSIQSVSSTMTFSDQRHTNGSSSLSRLQDLESDIHPRRLSFASDAGSISRPAPAANRYSRPSDSSSSAPFCASSQTPERLSDGARTAPTHPVIRTDMIHQRSKSIDPARFISHGSQRLSAGSTGTATPISGPISAPISGPTSGSILPMPAAAAAAGPTLLPFVGALASSMTEPKKSSVPLLSIDDLDLLIETTFTVLEDMMDFSKGQSIRRMTFGMLRELVRKSYRTSAPAPSTSVPTAEETNGTATTTTTTTTATPATATVSSVRTQQEKDVTRDKARELVKMMLPGSLVTVLGREAVQRGLVDVFEMFQIKELNLGLALSVLEMTVRLVFTR